MIKDFLGYRSKGILFMFEELISYYRKIENGDLIMDKPVSAQKSPVPVDLKKFYSTVLQRSTSRYFLYADGIYGRKR